MKIIAIVSLAVISVFNTFAKDAKPAKPELTSITPRAMQHGTTAEFTLRGKNLLQLSAALSTDKKIDVKILPAKKPNAAITQVKITTDKSLPRGTHEIWLKNPDGESNRLKLYIGDLPQIHEPNTLKTTPATYWGNLTKAGEMDRIPFNARRGRTIVLDLRGKSLGSKANELVLTLADSRGRVLARSREGGEPLLAHTMPADGDYFAHIVDQQRAGSGNHFYRLTLGELPYVTGFFPPRIPLGKRTAIELIGHNLPPKQIFVAPKAAGDFTLPIDAAQFRFRKPFVAKTSNDAGTTELEPNDVPGDVQTHKLPLKLSGRIVGEGDLDAYRFRAIAGQTYVLETNAARRGSPLDTHLEVLDATGHPVRRVTLQAVRDSAINFRPINSTQTNCRVDNWEEMELNEFLWLEGEVVKFFRAPRGPDSGFEFYKGLNGQRRTWFGTSAAAHAKDSPCYIVRPVRSGSEIVSTGLPVFHLNYENDDDGLRQFGTDSRLFFTAPADGEYLGRISDSRGRQGASFIYQLTIREAKPGFKVALEGANTTIPAGTGRSFTVQADRTDGFTGAIRVDLLPAPKGFHITTPLIIQAGHERAHGSIHAADDAPTDKPFKLEGAITATAMVAGKKIVQTVNALGTLKAGGKTDMFIGLETTATLKSRDATKGDRKFVTNSDALTALKPLEITIAPGETLPMWLAIQRAGRKGIQKISVDNLPHGIIIDNIGLNGVEIAAESDRREIFLACARWVPETDRLIFAANGKLASLPVLLKVRKK